MRCSWRIGRFGGIDALVHATSLLLIGWIVLDASFRVHSVTAVPSDVALFLALLGSIVLQKFGHPFTTRHNGAPTHNIALLLNGSAASPMHMYDSLCRNSRFSFPARRVANAKSCPSLAMDNGTDQ